MKQKRTKPRPIAPKKERDQSFWPDGYSDWLDDCERRERKAKGPSDEANKLLIKKNKI